MKKISMSFRKYFLLLFVVACSFNAFPVSDDVKLGKQVKEEIENRPNEFPILNNPTARRYVQNIVDEILRSPEIEYRKMFAYQVELIDDDKTVNAFCTPGGYIYVYTGLLKKLNNEAALAGVLGHEIAHAENRHSTQRMTKAYGASILANIIIGTTTDEGGDGRQYAELGANLMTGMALLKNSRDDELEADEDSFYYLESTQWYPASIKFFFNAVKGQSNSSAFAELFSTHPMPQTRLDQIDELIEKENLPPSTGANLYQTRYQKFLKTF